jgi:hypothetical protein
METLKIAMVLAFEYAYEMAAKDTLFTSGKFSFNSLVK